MAKNEKINPNKLSEEELTQKIMNKENKELCTLYEFVENNMNERSFKEKKIRLKSKKLYYIIY
jgi:hypothetical protein